MTAHTPRFTLPSGYHRIKVVDSFDELVGTPFGDGVNALCWRRTLPGDFSEVVEALAVDAGIMTVDESRLKALSLSSQGRAARDILLGDQQLLRDCGLSPILDCIHDYPCDTDAGPVPTDVYSFHVDSATVDTDTYLCSYHAASSEGLRNDEAQRCTDIPGIRAALLSLFGGEDNDGFREYLRENCYDLHYAALPQAQPFSFGLGDLWRIAVDYPGSPVPPCIHRAPATLPGQKARLLLIS
ncbi:MAG: hypothetical protein SGI98_04995 [Verrucomicrobiota bacterium]|nr:hypothetical protein [Verrucomicrobiota bacterium]